MAEHHHVQHENTLEDACVDAFVEGNKREAVRLLPLITRPAAVRTDRPIYLMGERVSLLHYAAYHGWQDVVCELVTRYNCSVNYCDSKGQTALQYAAGGGHLEVVTYLITKQHCQPTRQDKYGCTPLHDACDSGHLNITQYLITEQNCDPSCKNERGETPLR